MGSQINFFLGPQDLLTISKEIGSVGDPVFLHPTSEAIEPKEVENIIPVYGSEVLRILIARREDLPSIVFRPRQGHRDYISDTQDSLVIEFGRPYVADHLIRAGRLYRDDKFWLKDGHSQPKPEEWVSWAKKLFEKCRRSLARIGDSGYFAGQQAIAMRQTGVVFQQLDDPKNLL
jgi:hypothetical protein